MQSDYRKAQIQDGILGVIVEKSSFPLFEIGMAYMRLKSFDKLLSCIDKATQERRSLESVVDVLMEGRQCVSIG